MSIPQVGQGAVAVVPTFKGFRKSTDNEMSGAVKSASSIFGAGFKTAGSTAGKGFASSFDSATKNLSSAGLKAISAEVTKSGRDVANARLKELDVTGRLRLAETQLSEARAKYSSGSSQVIRAEERLATASRQLATAQDSVRASSDRLASSKSRLAAASVEAASSSGGFTSVLSRIPSFFGSVGSESAGRFGAEFRTSLGAVFGGATLAGLAFGAGRLIGTGVREGVDYTLGSVTLASDLSETTSAVEQVYGDAATDILSFTSTANRSLGQTRTQALRAAQTFGVFAKQAGLTGAPLASFSTGLVTLSADLASFYNSSPDEAIEALGAGLRGEAEPLRRFGVLLDDTTLRAKALELGIYDGNDALTGQQRILAAQAVIFAQTSIQQGDFERTSGGLANQQRILQASLEDTKTKFGEALLPAFTGAATFANDTLVPALDGILDKVGPKLAQALTDNGPEFDKLWTKAEPLITGFLDAAAEDGIPAFIDGLNGIIDVAPDVADSLAEIGSFLDWGLDPESGAGLNAINDGLTGASTAIREFFVGSGREERVRWGEEFIAGFSATGAQTSAGLTTGFEDGFIEADQGFKGFGLQGGSSFAAGIAEAKPVTITATDVLSGSALHALQQTDGFASAGSAFGEGVAQGIESTTSRVSDAAGALASAAVKRFEARLDINSPSRVMRKDGQNFGDGVALGILDRTGAVSSAASQIAQAAEGAGRLQSRVGGSWGAGSGGGLAPIYVQNPFTGDYLLAQVAGEARAAVGDYDRSTSETVNRGVRGWE